MGNKVWTGRTTGTTVVVWSPLVLNPLNYSNILDSYVALAPRPEHHLQIAGKPAGHEIDKLPVVRVHFPDAQISSVALFHTKSITIDFEPPAHGSWSGVNIPDSRQGHRRKVTARHGARRRTVVNPWYRAHLNVIMDCFVNLNRLLAPPRSTVK